MSQLREEVAKKYTCTHTPGVIVTRPHPTTGKRKTVDLSKISVAEADELVSVYKTPSLVPIEKEPKAAKESK